jgi:hypothetical protein
MNDPLLMSDLLTLPDTPSVTSSPESGGGALRSGSPGGEMSGPYGPGVVPARDSAQPAKGEGLPIPAISGPPGSISSASAALQSCLESRLKQRFGTGGSILFRETWRERVTPSGRVYWAHTASGRRISGRDCGLEPLEQKAWTTPQAHDVSGRSEGQKEKHGTKHGCGCLVREALSSWPTPNAVNGDRAGFADHEKLMKRLEAGHQHNLQEIVKMVELATWPSPNSTDYIEREQMRPSREATGRTVGYLSEAVVDYATPWGTPSARDWKDGGSMDSDVPENSLLGRQVWQCASWSTPKQMDSDRTDAQTMARFNMRTNRRNLIGDAGMSAPGATSNGSPAATGSPGQLNPAFSRWLQGYPEEWDACAPMGTPSSRRLPRNSSKRSRKCGV